MLKNILCATDGSKVSEEAIDFAAAAGKAFGAPVTFLTVSHVDRASAAGTHFWDARTFEAGERQLSAEMRAVKARAEAGGLTQARHAVVQGRDVAKAIVAYAEAHGHDHVIMGSHGSGGIERLLLGSVASAVVARAPCPVTIVRHRRP
ncbi:MAG: universal stress protein [Geminicoccaceae bacterium]|nr:universal stress protein [Geminicoccaceae bacterium]